MTKPTPLCTSVPSKCRKHLPCRSLPSRAAHKGRQHQSSVQQAGTPRGSEWAAEYIGTIKREVLSQAPAIVCERKWFPEPEGRAERGTVSDDHLTYTTKSTGDFTRFCTEPIEKVYSHPWLNLSHCHSIALLLTPTFVAGCAPCRAGSHKERMHPSVLCVL